MRNTEVGPDRRAIGRAFAALALAAASCCLSAPAAARDDALPRLVKIVVPYSPGGSNDVFARALAKQLAPSLGVPVVVENKPGAGGAIGAEAVARAEPDGGTLLLTSVSFSTNAAVQTNLPYDPLRSFTPVALVSHGPMLLTVSNTTPWKSTADYLAAARDGKTKISYGSSGLGSIGQMGSALLNTMTGTHAVHVPYKGISNAVVDMIAGNIQVMVTTQASVAGPLKAGQIRALAVTSPQRSAFAPELPTVAEQVPGYAVEAWWGVFAPANTPRALVDKFNALIRNAGQTAEMRALYARESTDPGTMSADQFGAFLASEVTKWRKLAKESNLVAQ